MQGKQRVDGSGRDVGMMRRAAVEAAQRELEEQGAPDLADSLAGWMQWVEGVMDEMMERDDGMRRCLGAVEEKMGRVEKTLTAMLKQHGARGQTQAERVVDSVQHMRDEMMRMRVGQGEIARLVRQMGVGVGNVDSGLGGLGGTVRAIQRQLEARAKHEKRLANSVSRMERAGAMMGQAVEEGMRQQPSPQQPSPPPQQQQQHLSPLGSGRKGQRVGGSWEGKGEQERKKLLFGAEQKEQEQEQTLEEEVEEMLAQFLDEDERRLVQEAAEREEKEKEKEQEDEEGRAIWMKRARRGEKCLLEGDVVPCTSAAGEPAMDVTWICPCGACDGEAYVREWVVPRVMEEVQEYSPPCGTKVHLRCWERETEEGAGGAEGILRYGWGVRVVGDEKREEEKSELRELGEKEMGMWDDGREMREEVQLFGCASTAE
jgi:hypothetical protein